MKLKQIKLAGFKSFVDPTVLDLKSDLVSVVGPNGCGKSNVIDAVRWVMGESSAKTLRGESITDVIFNGSNTRKPIGQASIELIFDNSAGTIGGEYASYAEICIRREVNREAVSNYYLNGTRCRRRDIVDVFLGTGLGSRSYSIIEQGMISRIIESKPEDLRTFVEEAAGISVYKKRRHDTELRMRHTAENLSRLTDLREEQTKLLERLKRQSESAQKYRVFSSEKELLEAQLLTLRWQEYDAKLLVQEAELRNLSLNLEEKLAEKSSIDLALEKSRAAHEENSDIFNTIQTKYYELGSNIARKEQSLQHHKERKLQLESDLKDINLSIIEIQTQKGSDDVALAACLDKLKKIIPEHEQAVRLAEQTSELHHDARLALETCAQDWDDFQVQSQAAQQEAELQKMRIEQLDKQTRDLQARIDRLQQESGSLDIANIEITLKDLDAELSLVEQGTNAIKQEIQTINTEISNNRSVLHLQDNELNAIRNSIQQNKGRESSLLALQQAALGKDDKLLQDWLNKNSLNTALRVAESISVDNGWEIAVETVLAEYLDAICLDDNLDQVLAAVNELTAGKLTIIGPGLNFPLISNLSAQPSLATKVKTNLPITKLLSNVIAVENVNDALSLRSQLQQHQSIVTKDGVWLGDSWVRVSRERDGKRGIIEREQEIRDIKANLLQQQALALELESSIAQNTEKLHNFEHKLTQAQHLLSQDMAKLRDVSSRHSAAQQKYEHMFNRKQRISIEIEEHTQQLLNNSADSSSAMAALEIAIEAMAEHAQRKQKLLDTKEQLLNKEKSLRINAKEQQDLAHDLGLIKQGLVTEQKGLELAIGRIAQQLDNLELRSQQLQQILSGELEPNNLLQEELDTLLENRVSVELELQEARRNLEVFEEQLKSYEKQRSVIEKSAQDLKDILDNCRLERQSLEIRKEAINEQLIAHAVDLRTVQDSMPQDADEKQWVERIEVLGKKISNLGAINMAAIEEFDTETARSQYLESQFTDLKEAMTTLENAIHKIDRETRSKFKETFEQINKNFTVLFPKLFGGGKAYLEIVGEDLLDAGVTVMAMPPGKKNSTIHLLSGGEKALTAVSLVFSIFQLNPAPFCMLDEVDAPLDETNVIRFGSLIKEMSATVQFIIITHNKTTMEIANQLIGVTMKEPGVSRLVSVDINEAVELVAV